MTYQRTDFAASMIDGRTVTELDPHSRSAAEIAQLWSYIDARLKGGIGPTVLSSAQTPTPLAAKAAPVD